MPRPDDEETIAKLEEKRKNFTPRAEILLAAKSTLAQEVQEKGYVYIGPNAERRFNLNRMRLNSVIAWLKEDGFVVHFLELEHPDSDETIIVKVLARGDKTYQDAWNDRGIILRLWVDAQSIGKN